MLVHAISPDTPPATLPLARAGVNARAGGDVGGARTGAGTVPPDMTALVISIILEIKKQEAGMKRLHLHVAVDDLDRSIGFYSTLFGTGPMVAKADYAKWMLEDPKVNFAISARGVAAGVDHVGIQVESAGELGELADRLKAAGEVTRDQEGASCCYAKSDKAWVSDPSGLKWETFFTFGEATTYGEDGVPDVAPKAACCAPRADAKACC
jgi:catechol 2,3-dioxygenase-like lactoylglutathione lyase family enzyme